MLNYEELSPEIEELVIKNTAPKLSEYACLDSKAVRKDESRDIANAIRTPFIRDIDKIMHCPYFNRYSDKTQVFSFYKNDDLSRRALHVQLVSRIARTIGKALGLNLDLIEAIALGHDIGHAPFAHTGEKYLDEILFKHSGRHFNHNIQSVQVLDKVFPYNITLQTLDGIACHNGEMELSEYRPVENKSFEDFDREIESCYESSENIKKLVPSTLEACVVRISDIIAYIGKDRQDAERTHRVEHECFERCSIGTHNAELINNLTVNIIENSVGKPYIKMDDKHFSALKVSKAENYKLIYKDEKVQKYMDETVKPMMADLFGTFLDDLKTGNRNSPVFTSHIDYVNMTHYKRAIPYEKSDPNQIVTDYIASMTDDYFVGIYNHVFPENSYKIKYEDYF